MRRVIATPQGCCKGVPTLLVDQNADYFLEHPIWAFVSVNSKLGYRSTIFQQFVAFTTLIISILLVLLRSFLKGATKMLSQD